MAGDVTGGEVADEPRKKNKGELVSKLKSKAQDGSKSNKGRRGYL